MAGLAITWQDQRSHGRISDRMAGLAITCNITQTIFTDSQLGRALRGRAALDFISDLLSLINCLFSQNPNL